MSMGFFGLLRFNVPNLHRMRQRHPNLWWTLIATLIYSLVTIVITYPLAFNLSSGLAGRGDSLEYNWVL